MNFLKILGIVALVLIVIGPTRGGHVATAVHGSGVSGGPLLLILIGLVIFGLAANR